jgi:hypothetical protein
MMNKSRKRSIAILVSLPVMILTASIAYFAQEKAKPAVCRAATLASFKPLPKLRYRCAADLTESDEKILKQPSRIRAIKALELSLASFNSPGWWQASVAELKACELRRKPRARGQEGPESSSDLSYDLLGDHSLRLALLPDPCYQTGYSGSNAFLLYRKGGQTFVTQVLDGFYSRADSPVGLDFAALDGQKLVEISTGTGGWHPSITNYYFVIDPTTNRAVAKKLFKGDKGLTNEISSGLLMGEPEEFNLPKDGAELSIIRQHKLAPSFSLYAEDSEGKIAATNGKMTRTVLRNGRFYE